MRVGTSLYTVLPLAVCVALGGCKARDNGAATTSTGTAMSSASGDTMAPPSAAAGAADTSAAAAGGATSGAKLSDANIAALVDEVNVADSTLAAAALPKLTSPGAKSFAKLMMGEHHAAHVQGIRVAKQQKINPELPATDPFKPAVEAEQSALASMSKGPAYDSTYISNEAGIHQAVLDWAGKNPPENAAYQQYMKTVGEVVQKHLKEAQRLEKTMRKSQA